MSVNTVHAVQLIFNSMKTRNRLELSEYGLQFSKMIKRNLRTKVKIQTNEFTNDQYWILDIYMKFLTYYYIG